MTVDRRSFWTGMLALPLLSAAAPAWAQAGLPDLRGALDATTAGVRSGQDDQTRALRRLLVEAAGSGRPLFLPPGRYPVADLTIPAGARLIGVPGRSRLVFRGGARFVVLEPGPGIALDGLVLDGDRKAASGAVEGGLHGLDIAELVLEQVTVTGYAGSGVYLERCGGRVARSTIERCGDIGLFSRDARALAIVDNTVRDCANGGILVHRRVKGEDGSQVRGNRIERIGSVNGGTGQWGNGVNVYLAGNVQVADNRITDCAFTAVRSNNGDAVQITGNQCLRLGETAIYSEFGFVGAVIANNVVDGAANGISVANFNEGGRIAAITGNVVRNLRRTGPYPGEPMGFGWGIWAEADASITGNIVENAPQYGIGLGYGPYLRDVAVTSNVIRQADIGIAVTVVDGARSTVIANNIIRDTRRGAIIGMRWNDAATGDLAKPGAVIPPHLIVEGNRVG